MKIKDAINLAIENVKKEGITDVEAFRRPFEIDMLGIAAVCMEVTAEINTQLKEVQISKMGFKPISHMLVPKKELFDFRRCAIIEPVDELKYLALTLQIAQYVEQKRPAKSKNRVFSYRFHPDKGLLFDSKYNYTAFREYVSKKSHQKNVSVVVSCDIANFYDRLNLHRLECILSSIPKIESKIISQINELLLFWSNRDSYGIPVGSNASRILAEASLIEVDNFLLSHNISYCRFVDDFRIFAPDAATAHKWLSLLVDRLSREGLFLNTNKTEIKDVSRLNKHEPEEKAAKDDPDTLSGDSSQKEAKPQAEGAAQTIATNSTDAHQKHTAHQSVHEVSRIIRGYSGLIPTKFRALTSAEEQLFQNSSAELSLSKIKGGVLVDPKIFVATTKICAAKKDSAGFVALVDELKKFPQFIPYTIDALIKHEAIFSEEQIKSISDALEFWLNRENAPEFVSVYVVRIFGAGRFKNKRVLFNRFRDLRRNDGSYIGRAILEQLEPLVERGEVIEIRDYFTRADWLERRQIAKMVDIHLTDGEKRPFFKNILTQSQDTLLKYIKDNFSKTKKGS